MGFFLGKIFRFLLVIYVGVFFFLLVRPFPDALKHEPAPVRIDPSAVTFLSDVTYVAENGAVRTEETIFPAMLSLVEGARNLVYADMFLFNQFQGKEPETRRDETRELADALIAKRSTHPSAVVTFVTDPINRGYGGLVNEDLDRMASSGVRVFETPIERLRDSNLLWSTVYRMFFAWFGNSTEGGWLPNPLDAEGEKVTLRTYARLLNFKANHRKILVTDSDLAGKRVLATLIGSLNPHTASSANGNVALLVRDEAFSRRVITSENALLALGGHEPVVASSSEVIPVEGSLLASYLTEANIEKAVIEVIDALESGATLDLALFYLSDRDVIAAIEEARGRGVVIRILLDGNDSAFGKHKYGIPNRQTAERLMEGEKEGLSVRWCNTHGEQCHAKMLIASGKETSLIIGSANYTRRNLDGYNLESAVLLSSASPAKVMTDAKLYMNRLWENTKGETSLPFDSLRDRASWKRTLAWIMETTGLSTF
jgi:hypothetical protein